MTRPMLPPGGFTETLHFTLLCLVLVMKMIQYIIKNKNKVKLFG